MISSIIAPHKTTLRSITVGSLHEKSLVGFDLTGFENLTHISLSTWATGSTTGDETNLLAPRLTTFRWVFTVEDQHSESLFCFGEAQEHWLRSFIAAAIAWKLPLENIYIQYAPEGYYLPQDRPVMYPWDRMKNIATDIQDEGINLSWTPPTVSREDFQDFQNLSMPMEEEYDMHIGETDNEEDGGDSVSGSDVSGGFPAQRNNLLCYCHKTESGDMIMSNFLPEQTL